MQEDLVRNAFLPLHERLRGRGTIRRYRELLKWDHEDGATLEQYRDRKLTALLRHCYRNVSYYRDRFRAAGVEDERDIQADALALLPAMERSTIREQGEGLLAAGWESQLMRHTTGGSTGEPLVFYTDRHKEVLHNAQKLRCRHWFGVRPGDRQIDFWGSPIELSKQTRFRQWKDRYLLNQGLLSAFDLTDARLAHYADELDRFQPRLVYGYPTVIYRMALYMREHGGPRDWRPRLVACTSEMLYDHQRKAIQEVFDCPVANEYGARDGGLIAHECRMGNLHVVAEHTVVEVDSPDEHGVGDLLVTNLDGWGMPLLRYRIGDRAAVATTTCGCGLPHPTLGSLAGRANDFVVGVDGRLVHSLAPIYVLRERPAIEQFKLIQHKDLSLEILLVCREALSAESQQEIKAAMGKLFGDGVPVQLRIVDHIEPEASGKYRWVVSHASEAAA